MSNVATEAKGRATTTAEDTLKQKSRGADVVSGGHLVAKALVPWSASERTSAWNIPRCMLGVHCQIAISAASSGLRRTKVSAASWRFVLS